MNLEQIKSKAFNNSKENEKKLSKQQKTSIKTYDCLVKNDYLNKVNYENDKEFYNLISTLSFALFATDNPDPFYAYNDVKYNGEKTITAFSSKDALVQFKKENLDYKYVYVDYSTFVNIIDYKEVQAIVIYTSYNKKQGYGMIRLSNKTFQNMKSVKRFIELLSKNNKYEKRFLTQNEEVDRFYSLHYSKDDSIEHTLETCECFSNLIFAIPLYNGAFMKGKIIDGDFVEDSLNDIYMIGNTEGLNMYLKSLKKHRKNISFVYINFNDLLLLVHYMGYKFASFNMGDHNNATPVMLSQKWLELTETLYTELNIDPDAESIGRKPLEPFKKTVKLVNSTFKKDTRVKKVWICNVLETKANGKEIVYDVMVVDCSKEDFYDVYLTFKEIVKKTVKGKMLVVNIESGLATLILQNNDVSPIFSR